MRPTSHFWQQNTDAIGKSSQQTLDERHLSKNSALKIFSKTC